MDTHSLIKQITEQLSNSSLEEEQIKELCPINFIWDYYDNPMEINVGEKKYTIEWRDEESRIKEINRINKIIAEYSVTKGKHPIKPILLWAFNCYPIHVSNPNSTSNQIEDLKYWTVDDEELFKTRVEIRTVDFIEYLNKEIFIYIQGKVQTAMKIGAWDSNNMWFEPNKMFLQWIELKGIDPESKDNKIPDFLPRWGKEVVRLLLKKGKKKHQDILLSINELPLSYTHINKIFKTPNAKEFLDNEIQNDGGYYSLREPSKFK